MKVLNSGEQKDVETKFNNSDPDPAHVNTKEMAIFKIILKLLILSFLHNNLQNKIGITVSWKERSRVAGGRKDVRRS